ncbi:MAG: enoyl-CoA hydratase/isomerase family protein [Caldilineaceae bacterium]
METPTEPQIRLAVEGPIATITLARADKLNALTPAMLASLEEIATELEQDDTVRVVLLRGEGRAFCVGADIHAWTALEPQQMWRLWIRNGHRVFERVARLPQPVIAAVHGFAFGGGLELAMAADIRIAAEGTAFALPEVTLATVPGWGGTQRLPAKIGLGRAKRMVYTGERIDAQTAERWGLVEEVVPADRLVERVQELAATIARNAPLAVQLAKQVMSGDSIALEAMAGALAATTEDAKEGLAAFRERRTPQFTGK